LPGLRWNRADQVGPRLRPAALAVQGLRAAVHAHHAARQASPAMKREAVGLYCAGLSLSAVGERLGVSAQKMP